MRQLVISKQITVRNDESINRYLSEISKFERITPEEEVELSVRIKKGDTIALQKLVTANLRFVISVAKQYQNQGLSFSDLINEGNVGLVKAASKYDETRGFKFISYAVWWIRQSIMQAISEQTRVVRLPINRISSINKIAKAIPYLEQEFEREPTESEIADYLEIADEEVHLAQSIKRRHVSFDKPVSREDESGGNLYELFADGETPAPDTKVINESLSTDLHRAIQKLTPREGSVLTMSYGLNSSPALSLRDIGEKLGMTSERVRQIREKGLVRLRLLLDKNHSYLND